MGDYKFQASLSYIVIPCLKGLGIAQWWNTCLENLNQMNKQAVCVFCSFCPISMHSSPLFLVIHVIKLKSFIHLKHGHVAH